MCSVLSVDQECVLEKIQESCDALHLFVCGVSDEHAAVQKEERSWEEERKRREERRQREREEEQEREERELQRLQQELV